MCWFIQILICPQEATISPTGISCFLRLFLIHFNRWGTSKMKEIFYLSAIKKGLSGLTPSVLAITQLLLPWSQTNALTKRPHAFSSMISFFNDIKRGPAWTVPSLLKKATGCIHFFAIPETTSAAVCAVPFVLSLALSTYPCMMSSLGSYCRFLFNEILSKIRQQALSWISQFFFCLFFE